MARPGVPAPTRLSAFVVPDRPSPVQRLPDKDGHYVFELGENLSSRCAPLLPPVGSTSDIVCSLASATLSQRLRPYECAVRYAVQIRSSAKWAKVCCGCFCMLRCCRTVSADTCPCSRPRASAGTFGRVLECWDRKNKDYCAVKIVRNVKKYRDAAMIEVRQPRYQPHQCGDTAALCDGALLHSADTLALTAQLEVLATLESNDPDGEWCAACHGVPPSTPFTARDLSQLKT